MGRCKQDEERKKFLKARTQKYVTKKIFKLDKVLRRICTFQHGDVA